MGKCSQAAPAFINHPLIDKLIVSNEWQNEDPRFIEIKKNCDVVINQRGPHYSQTWQDDCITQIDLQFKSAGIFDHRDVLEEAELHPVLYKWWTDPRDVDHPANAGYGSTKNRNPKSNKEVCIIPFAKYGNGGNRNPTKQWWDILVEILVGQGYTVYHIGWGKDPHIDKCIRLCDLSYFEQIKYAVQSDVTVSSDAGTSWYVAAYGTPIAVVTTFWNPNHKQNEYAYVPPNPNVELFFNPKSCNLVKHKSIIDYIERVV